LWGLVVSTDPYPARVRCGVGVRAPDMSSSDREPGEGFPDVSAVTPRMVLASMSRV
jgi:hypothetical protein